MWVESKHGTRYCEILNRTLGVTSYLYDPFFILLEYSKFAVCDEFPQRKNLDAQSLSC